MKQQTIRQIAAVFLSALAIGICLLIALRIYVRNTLHLTKAYVASHDILPRTKILEEDLVEVQIPEDYLMEDSYRDKEKILGKYTDIQGRIPAGSPFYFSMLHEESKLPDYPSLQLEIGQVQYSLPCDSSASSFVAGQRLDLFIKIEGRQDTPGISGPLLQNVRILSIQDHKGVDVAEKDSTGIPGNLIVAINQEDLEMISYAETLGTFQVYTTSQSYDSSLEATRPQESYALEYVQHSLENAKKEIQETIHTRPNEGEGQ